MKARLIAAAFAITTIMVSAGSPAKADLITNGGFETGNFSGWAVGGNTSFTGVDSFAPHSGTFGAFSGAVNTPATLQQSAATTAGVTYEISFWLAVEADVTGASTPNAFTASFGGTGLASFVNMSPQSYIHYSYNVLATSGSSDLSFTFQHNPAFFDIDDVSVNAVPGPIVGAGLPGLVMAFGGLFAWRRRQKQLAA